MANANVVLINTSMTRKATIHSLEKMGVDLDRPLMNRKTNRILGWRLTGKTRHLYAVKSPAGGAA